MENSRLISVGCWLFLHLITPIDGFPNENARYTKPVAAKCPLANQNCPGHPMESSLDERWSSVEDSRLISGGIHLLLHVDGLLIWNVHYTKPVAAQGPLATQT